MPTLASLIEARDALSEQIYERVKAFIAQVRETGEKAPGEKDFFQEARIDAEDKMLDVVYSSYHDLERDDYAYPLALVENPTPEAMAQWASERRQARQQLADEEQQKQQAAEVANLKARLRNLAERDPEAAKQITAEL